MEISTASHEAHHAAFASISGSTVELVDTIPHRGNVRVQGVAAGILRCECGSGTGRED
jgi:hypothetical protein